MMPKYCKQQLNIGLFWCKTNWNINYDNKKKLNYKLKLYL